MRYLAISFVLPVLVLSCGTNNHHTCQAGPCYLVGDFTPEEAQALTEVGDAIVAAGYDEPGYAVNFVHSPNDHFKGTTWADWRVGGIEPRNPDEGYRGYCERRYCMVFVRRYGEAEPYLRELLVHELVHAMGYDHGPEMRAVEQRIKEELP